MKARSVLGHIDCPACGVAGSVRITHDKNGEPFGYCVDGCQLQLRIGGNAHRVKCFTKRHHWAAAPGEADKPEPVPVTVPVTATPAAAPAPKAPPKAPPKSSQKAPEIPVTVTAQKAPDKPAAKPAPTRSGLEDVFAFLGGQK